ncbi:MAG: bifunctional diaminohydroxyphosphoribosylaminopyrimidine deaminase/5-amino-6-(5-phosphoribosylamino)uracil reductase RibD [Albidovulum sp.]
MTPDIDRHYMAHALGLARRGLGQVWPNPAVGCVIAGGGRIIGRGWTQAGGRPHAETVALAQAGTAARGATAYVTLEPCAHHGHTPPCAEALIDAGISRVVAAFQDPDARVAGRGLAILEAAGIEVTKGVMRTEAEALQKGFLSRIRLGRPMVTLKLAISLDGRIATSSGESQWITGPQARARVHAMRALHDAVMIGGGTARADNPTLTVRGLGIAHQPLRIVATRALDLPADGQLAGTATNTPLWLMHGPSAPPATIRQWEDIGARLFCCEETAKGLDPSVMLAMLGQAGLTRIFCEGGGQLGAALLSAGMVDELALFTGGVMLGGDARPCIAALGLDRLADAPGFALQRTETLGPDTLSLWRRS